MNRGDIFLVDLNQATGVELGGVRPVLIISNDDENKFTPTVLIAPITSKVRENLLPTHANIDADQSGLKVGGVILLEQIKAIDKSRLMKKIGSVDKATLSKIVDALQVSLGITEPSHHDNEVGNKLSDLDSNKLGIEYDKFVSVK